MMKLCVLESGLDSKRCILSEHLIVFNALFEIIPAIFHELTVHTVLELVPRRYKLKVICGVPSLEQDF
jgi:hypothetical protein